jgi:hypothetical protein
MAMAQDTAAIGGIDFNGLGDDGKKECRTGEIISDDSLYVAIGHATARRKWNTLCGERTEPNGKLYIFLGHLAHRELGKQKLSGCIPCKIGAAGEDRTFERPLPSVNYRVYVTIIAKNAIDTGDFPCTKLPAEKSLEGLRFRLNNCHLPC